MSNTNNGGPAFPLGTDRFNDGELLAERWEGMTLRDYFAAKAMQALVYNRSPNDAAIEAYEYADSMLKARNQ